MRELVAGRGETELLFRGAHGAALRPGNLRYRVLIPAAQRAGLPWARFHTLRHTCAAMLIDASASPLRLQRGMGHHSAAFTLDTYGHLLDDDLGPHLDVGFEMPGPVTAREARCSRDVTGKWGSGRGDRARAAAASVGLGASPNRADRQRTHLCSPRSSCVNTLPRTAAAECVEVTGGHLGLVFNRKSYRAIAQALAAPGLAPGLPERPVASLV
jgi:hypothetical protein